MINEVQFSNAFYQVLKQKGLCTPTFNSKQLCRFYENLSGDSKRGIWTSVGLLMNLKPKQALKHYINSFKKCIYSDNLEFKKHQINPIIQRMVLENCKKSDIVAACKRELVHENIFPAQLESYVYEQIQKLLKHGVI